VTRPWAGLSRFDSQQGLGIFLFSTVSRLVLGSTQPPIQWVPGVFSPGVKWLGHEADNSPPYSAEVMNVWSYTATPQCVLMVWCLVKYRDNFTFYLYLQYYSLRRKENTGGRRRKIPLFSFFTRPFYSA